MESIDWLQMITYQQELHRFARKLLPQGQKQSLTASERELLALLYLEPGGMTPLALSRHTGMKKEAVSRCLKHLYEKGYIQREPHPQDDRSYLLSLTEAGRIELKKDCETILNPLYHLRRNMGEHFVTLFELISEVYLQIVSRRNIGF